jgi:TonB-dependent starch-binding outer membrane protein SusC
MNLSEHIKSNEQNCFEFMKKKRFAAYIITAMRITIVQLGLIVTFVCSAYANKTDAQILDKRVSINARNTEIKTILAEVKKQVGIKFIFSRALIKAERKITCEATDKKLSDFFEEVLRPINIGYKVFDDQILLFPIANEENADAGLKKPIHVPVFIRIISGNVTSSDGKPLAGASVNIKGSSHGTTTDSYGNFKLQVSDSDKVLVVSFTGYISQ